MAVEIATTRFMKDDVNTYDESLIYIAKEINANFILLSFTPNPPKDVLGDSP